MTSCRHYGMSSRQIVRALQTGGARNSGCRIRCTFTATISACRGTSSRRSPPWTPPTVCRCISRISSSIATARKVNSASPRRRREIAEAVNAAKNVTIDVGQTIFGQTVTVSCDTMSQF